MDKIVQTLPYAPQDETLEPLRQTLKDSTARGDGCRVASTRRTFVSAAQGAI